MALTAVSNNRRCSESSLYFWLRADLIKQNSEGFIFLSQLYHVS